MATQFAKAAADPSVTLQTFTFDDLAQFTSESSFDPESSPDFRLFLVGRDDCHSAVKYLLARCSMGLKFNMFGYDDDELNGIIVGLLDNPNIVVQGTLDKSQAGGVHERKILDADRATDADFANHIAIGNSATHQISHTKGGVIDGKVAWEGSMNWSASGEGIGIALGGAKPPAGYKAQNNSLLVFTGAVEVRKFSAQLDAEHAIAVAQQAKAATP